MLGPPVTEWIIEGMEVSPPIPLSRKGLPSGCGADVEVIKDQLIGHEFVLSIYKPNKYKVAEVEGVRFSAGEGSFTAHDAVSGDALDYFYFKEYKNQRPWDSDDRVFVDDTLVTSISLARGYNNQEFKCCVLLKIFEYLKKAEKLEKSRLIGFYYIPLSFEFARSAGFKSKLSQSKKECKNYHPVASAVLLPYNDSIYSLIHEAPPGARGSTSTVDLSTIPPDPALRY